MPFDVILPLCIHPWFNLTTLYIPLSYGWVYLFMIKRGLFTDLLTNKVLICIGDHSAYLFLIHSVVSFYTDRLLNLLDAEPSGILLAAVILAEFAVTFILAYFYSKAEKKLNGRYNKGKILLS